MSINKTQKLKSRPCKRCGAPIIDVTDAEGKRQVVDARRHPVFKVAFNQHAVAVGALRVEGRSLRGGILEEVHVSHYVTCPHASEFSKGKTE